MNESLGMVTIVMVASISNYSPRFGPKLDQNFRIKKIGKIFLSEIGTTEPYIRC